MMPVDRPGAALRVPFRGVGGDAVLANILLVFLVVASVGLVAVVLLQSGRSAGLSGAIAGGAETLFGKKKGLDAFLGKLTTGLAVAFMLFALLLTVFAS